jgi:hypothetical protein
MIMEPLTILGALFGSFLNRLLPEFFLILMLAVVLAATANKTLSKGFDLWTKETKENKTNSAAAGNVKKRAGYDLVANEDDLERALDAADHAESKGGWAVGQKVKVRNQPTETWKRATVASFQPGADGQPLAQREGHAVAYTWNEMEAVDNGGGSRGALSPLAGPPRSHGSGSNGSAMSPSSPGEQAEAAGGDVATELGGPLEALVDKYPPVGTVAPNSIVALFAELPCPIGFVKAERVLPRQSSRVRELAARGRHPDAASRQVPPQGARPQQTQAPAPGAGPAGPRRRAQRAARRRPVQSAGCGGGSGWCPRWRFGPFEQRRRARRT